jgi:hypothetical protein
MSAPTFITLMQARAVLADMGVSLTRRQIKRAAEMDAHGRRKLPFFIDPIDKKLKIDRGELVRIYQELQIDAKNNLRD